MKIVIAMDSFKGSLTSMEAGNAVKAGIEKVCDAEIVVKPIADGGEGTTEALVSGLGGEQVTVEVTDPLGRKIQAVYGILRDGTAVMEMAQAAGITLIKKEERDALSATTYGVDPLGRKIQAVYGILRDGTAVMEMAQAAGITLIKKEERDALSATTYGVGEMIRDAIKRGCRKFLIGIGGSATSDGGVGMLQALGYRFLDADGKQIRAGVKHLDEISMIDCKNVLKEINMCHFVIACDVKNPLLGEKGAVYVYGPQKGIQKKDLEDMERKMRHFAEKTTEHVKKDYRMAEGAGAAGGVGFAFFSYIPHVEIKTGIEVVLDAVGLEKEHVKKDYRMAEGAGAAGGVGFAFFSYIPHVEIKTGIEVVLDAVGLEKELAEADYVVTGEGQLDGQTAMGKTPVGVAKLAKKYGARVLAFAGSVTEDARVCNQEGIDAFFPIIRGVTTLGEAMNSEYAKKNMELTVEQVFRLLIPYKKDF